MCQALIRSHMLWLLSSVAVSCAPRPYIPDAAVWQAVQLCLTGRVLEPGDDAAGLGILKQHRDWRHDSPV